MSTTADFATAIESMVVPNPQGLEKGAALTPAQLGLAIAGVGVNAGTLGLAGGAAGGLAAGYYGRKAYQRYKLKKFIRNYYAQMGQDKTASTKVLKNLLARAAGKGIEGTSGAALGFVPGALGGAVIGNWAKAEETPTGQAALKGALMGALAGSALGAGGMVTGSTMVRMGRELFGKLRKPVQVEIPDIGKVLYDPTKRSATLESGVVVNNVDDILAGIKDLQAGRFRPGLHDDVLQHMSKSPAERAAFTPSAAELQHAVPTPIEARVFGTGTGGVGSVQRQITRLRMNERELAARIAQARAHRLSPPAGQSWGDFINSMKQQQALAQSRIAKLENHVVAADAARRARETAFGQARNLRLDAGGAAHRARMEALEAAKVKLIGAQEDLLPVAEKVLKVAPEAAEALRRQHIRRSVFGVLPL